MRNLFISMLGALFALLALSPALADAVGSAKGVDPQAQSLLENSSRTLLVGSDVFLGDKITTGPKGLVQIVFVDNTKFVVGPNSSVTIDDYLLRGDNTAGKVAIDLLGGSFRFIAGDSPKNAYEISTPTGTIGVRGTEYDVYVEEDTGIAYVMVYLGNVLLSDNDSQRQELTGFCHIGVIDIEDTEILGDSNAIFGEDRDDLKGWFKFSIDQSRLLPEFRVGRAGTCTRRPPVARTPVSIGTSGGGSCTGGGELIDSEYGGYSENSCGQCPTDMINGNGEFGDPNLCYQAL